MKSPERLELLKEIAGTRTYDERRKESLKIMSDTDKRSSQIEEVITYIETRLGELEEEKQELMEFQECDTERRGLEYAIYDKELKAAEAKLQRIKQVQDGNTGKTGPMRQKLAERKNASQAAEEELKSLVMIVTHLLSSKTGWNHCFAVLQADELVNLENEKVIFDNQTQDIIRSREGLSLQVESLASCECSAFVCVLISLRHSHC